ncbi:hypothetical protein ACIGXM_07300 [Kitasatospora sp. NPDC052896]|uniref:hypothetical protein n=1 Tax=Kitasatospora sp. NPDC052896 TaxID=3364061 RepID=UPI0037C8F128
MSGDPVRELMVAHRALCERASHPLEIAAGLEEAGIGAAAVGRYRHGDVFSLAEELFARVPRNPGEPGGRPSPDPAPPVDRAGRDVGYRLGTAAALLGLLLLPLAARPSARAGALALAALLALPAAGGAARWARHAGRAQLDSARSIAEFRARMRPVLPVALAFQLVALALTGFVALGVQTALDPPPGALLPAVLRRAGVLPWAGLGTLGLLIGSTAVLRRCGRPAAALAGPLVADGLAAVLLALRALGLLPGRVLPPAALPAVAAGAAAVLLLPRAWTALGRPGSHR